MTTSRSLALIAGFTFVAALQGAGCSDSDTTGDNPTSSTTPAATSTTVGGGGSGVGAQGGGGTAGNGGMGGMITLRGDDTCPGDAVQLVLDVPIVLTGDTSMHSDDYQSFCSAGTSPDSVYEVSIVQRGTLTIAVNAMGGWDPAYYIRVNDCESTNAVDRVTCVNLSTDNLRAGKARTLDPGTYHVFVDGANDVDGGAYTMALTLTASQCGDGAIDALNNEQCDDGNTADNDGCNASCQFEPGSGDTCLARDVISPLVSGDTVFSAFTVGNSHVYDFDDATCDGVGFVSNAPDRVLEVVPQINGTMTATVGLDLAGTTPICETNANAPGCFNKVFSVRHETNGEQSVAACEATSNQVACKSFDDNFAVADQSLTLTVAVTAGHSYYFIVDSYWDGGADLTNVTGPYNIHFNLTP